MSLPVVVGSKNNNDIHEERRLIAFTESHFYHSHNTSTVVFL
jgi:hypothetical protein